MMQRRQGGERGPRARKSEKGLNEVSSKSVVRHSPTTYRFDNEKMISRKLTNELCLISNPPAELRSLLAEATVERVLLKGENNY